ncbi:MAG: nickel-responsive transcriptional regulator NikR [Kiritimatiellaeota bacterium]|nr:nickel-responsive transcriptional regulator NikR [Kiritimatiellota bacterium]
MKTDRLCRFSISMPAALAGQLDALVQAKGYANRSQAVAELVRSRLVEHHHELGDREIAGTITLVYDHHKPHLQTALTDIQHDHHDVIISTMHVHLDHHNCLEVLVVRGRGDVVRRIADELLAAKGIKHGRLTITTTGRDFES